MTLVAKKLSTHASMWHRNGDMVPQR